MTFNEWLEAHREHLLDYTAQEIACLALSCGFAMTEIAPEASSWLTRSRRQLRLYENPLATQWCALAAYQRRGETWEDTIALDTTGYY